MRIHAPRTILLATLAASLCAGTAGAAPTPEAKDLSADIAKQHPTPGQVGAADFAEGRTARAFLVRVQVLLDRARFHPGVVDGMPGENLDNAVRAFKRVHGMPDDAVLDKATWDALLGADGAPALVDYEVTSDDVEGPFTKTIPPKMELQAKLPRLGYRNASEKLGERFHMGAAFLKELNKGRNPAKAGTVLKVANVSEALDPTDAKEAGREIRKAAKENPDRPMAARVEVDKPGHQVTAFDKDGKVLATYPASIGSTDKPAPSGTLQVVRVAPNPGYTYNPRYAFKGVKAKGTFEIKPGPNNPVGAVWIQLTGEGYGIHGTPEPDRVGKTNSHGCIRLTNWNALELASLVSKDVPVEFKE
jgi:lipoprotein-anchoring transpeptidase ErfK/SrfK